MGQEGIGPWCGGPDFNGRVQLHALAARDIGQFQSIDRPLREVLPAGHDQWLRVELAGFKVQVAENGEKAVALFSQWSPQFIWMDMRMPVMDGLEATRRIRTLPGGDKVKIVAFTAGVMEEERKPILAAGCDDFVSKPYRESLLFEVMAKHLGVKYHYEENPPEIAIESETNICSLTTLPAGLRHALTRAVIELDTDRTLAVVEEITRQDAAIGPVLRKLAENLEYDRLLTMLEQNDGRFVA